MGRIGRGGLARAIRPVRPIDAGERAGAMSQSAGHAQRGPSQLLDLFKGPCEVHEAMEACGVETPVALPDNISFPRTAADVVAASQAKAPHSDSAVA